MLQQFKKIQEKLIPKPSSALQADKPAMFWHLLPYESYDIKSEIYFNHRSQGFILQIMPLIGANDETINILFSMISDVIPKEADVQFLLWGSDKVGHQLDAFQKARAKRDGIYGWLAEKRVEFLKKGVSESLATNGDYLIRDISLYMTVSLPVAKQQDHESMLVSLRKNIITSLKSIHTHAEPVRVDAFMSMLNDLLHPTSSIYPKVKNWNRYEPINRQLLDTECTHEIHPDCMIIRQSEGAHEVRALTVKDMPTSMAQWNMANAIGQLFNAVLQMPCPFIISFSMQLLDSDKVNTKVQWKYMDTNKKANSKLAMWLSKVSDEYMDWSFVRDRLKEGDRLASTLFHVMLYSPEGKGAQHEAKVKDLYLANGWKMTNAAHMHLTFLLATLPMLMSEGLKQDLAFLGYLRTITAFNAINIAPLQGEWKGTSSPILILPGRRGQIATWSPFDNREGNYNVAMAAASGKGKSALTQEYIVALLGAGGRVWVIDVGRSYEKTCRLLGGTFIEFSATSHICLNPFSYIRSFDESLALLKPLLAAMARPTTNTSDEENAYLEKALKAAWDKDGKKATITTVAEWLQADESPVCKNLSHLLYSYTRDGMYGRYFEGQSDIDISNHLVVLELQELKSKPDLQRIVLLTLMYQISEAMYWGERNQYKSCIIDEAWDLLSGEQEGTAKFIEVGYRTARKFNGNFLTIVQSINDYFKNSTSIAAFENSDYKLILGQTDEAIDQLKRSERLSMDPYTEHVLKSLRKTDEYSECVIKSPSGQSIHRIIFDPYSRILYSSKGDEYEAVKKLQSEGYSLSDAIEIVARKFTHA